MFLTDAQIQQLTPFLLPEFAERQLVWFDHFVTSQHDVFDETLRALQHMGAQKFINCVDDEQATPLSEKMALKHLDVEQLDGFDFELLSMFYLCDAPSSWETLSAIFDLPHHATEHLDALLDKRLLVQCVGDNVRYIVPGYLFHVGSIKPAASMVEQWVRYHSKNLHVQPSYKTCRRLLAQLDHLPRPLISRLMNTYMEYHRNVDLLESARFAHHALGLMGDILDDNAMLLHNIVAGLFIELGWFDRAYANLRKLREDPLVQASQFYFASLWFSMTCVFYTSHASDSAVILVQMDEVVRQLPMNSRAVKQCYTCWSQGYVAFFNRDFDRARQYWEDTLQQTILYDLEELHFITLECQAHLYLETNQPMRAQQALESLHTQTVDYPHVDLNVLLGLAGVYALSEQFEQSQAMLQRVIAGAGQHKLMLLHVEALFTLAIVQVIWCHLDEAMNTAKQACLLSNKHSVYLGPMVQALQIKLRAVSTQQAMAQLEALQTTLPIQRLFIQWIKHTIDPACLRPVDVHCHPQQMMLRLVAKLVFEPVVDLVVDFHSGKLQVGDAPIQNVAKRVALLKCLRLLIDAKKQGNITVSTVELFEAAWPDVVEFPANGMRRVYTEVHRLKHMGIAIERYDGGYRLAMDWRVVEGPLSAPD